MVFTVCPCWVPSEILDIRLFIRQCDSPGFFFFLGTVTCPASMVRAQKQLSALKTDIPSVVPSGRCWLVECKIILVLLAIGFSFRTKIFQGRRGSKRARYIFSEDFFFLTVVQQTVRDFDRSGRRWRLDTLSSATCLYSSSALSMLPNTLRPTHQSVFFGRGVV